MAVLYDGWGGRASGDGGDTTAASLAPLGRRSPTGERCSARGVGRANPYVCVPMSVAMPRGLRLRSGRLSVIGGAAAAGCHRGVDEQ